MPLSEITPSLADADWIKREETQALFAALNSEGYSTRAVGGAVRNSLIGRSFHEIDMATTAPPEETMRLARKAGFKAVPTGIDHGTVTIVIDHAPYEVTTLRVDEETYGRHAKVVFTDDWEEDASRRDFTVNALYADADGAIHDPLGGYQDLVAGRIRFIGDAATRIKEDYLRILRFFRFHAVYGKGPMDRKGLAASIRARHGLAVLSRERVRSEIMRLMAAGTPEDAVCEMAQSGLLIDVVGGVVRLSRFMRLCALERVLDREPDPVLRLAALAMFVVEDATRVGDRLRLSNRERALLRAWSLRIRDVSPALDGAGRLKHLYESGNTAFTGRVLLSWAASGVDVDDNGWRDLLAFAEKEPPPVLAIRGKDIVRLGIATGPPVGALLKKLVRWWIDGGFTAGRDELIEQARHMIEMGERNET